MQAPARTLLRKLGALPVVMALGLSALLGSTTAAPALAQPDPAPGGISVNVGYADTLRANPAKFPTPWYGSPNVIFEGCAPSSSCAYDAGAVEVVNNSGAAVTVDSVVIHYSTCTYDIWPHGVSLPNGGQLIVTQTGSGGGNGCTPFNGLMDSSDIGPNGAPWAGNCTLSGVIPEVDVSINGSVTSIPDPNQILNTGGIDQASCSATGRPAGNESAQWSTVLPPPPPGISCVPTGATLGLAPPSQSPIIGTTATVTATLTSNFAPANSCPAQPLPGAVVSFSVLSGPNAGLTGSGVTDANGQASFGYNKATPGTDTVQATTTNPAGPITSPSVLVNWVGHNTQVTFNGPGAGDFDDPVTFGATLMDTTASAPLGGMPLSFNLNTGAQACTGTTDQNGVATCSVTPSEATGSYPLAISFAGSGIYLPSSQTATFAVSLEESALGISSVTLGPAGSITVQAQLAEDGTAPIGGRTVSVQAGNAAANGTTDANGNVSAVLALAPNVFSASASFAGDTYYKAAGPVSKTFQHATTLTAGNVSGDYNDAANLAATLVDSSVVPSAPVASVPLGLSLNATQTCNATTDPTGTAACSITPNEAAGNYGIAASFAGNSQYLASNGAATFTVVTEETTLEIVSSPTLPNGGVVVKAVLKEDGQTPIGGRTVTFGAGNVAGTGTTDATGVASATLALGPGQYGLTATFAGDGYYKPATATAQTLYVFQPTTFVIWGGNPPIPAGQPANVTVGQDYTFWGAQWASQVQSGNFQANLSFKGFANSVSGASWTSDPGNSSGPPATVSSYVGVIVATQASKSGSVESGDVAENVVLRVDSPSTYQPDPGHPASGVLVAVIQ